MLQPGAVVRELVALRVMPFSEAMRDMCGRKELEWADSLSTTCLYTCSMLPAMLGYCLNPPTQNPKPQSLNPKP